MRFAAVPTLMLALLATAACAPSGDGRMVAVDPPQDWTSRLEADRASRDRFFREDPESPLLPEDRESFEGLDYYPPDASLRFEGPIHFYPQPEPLTVITTTGKTRPAERIGWLSFTVDGEVCVLQVYRLLDNDAVSGVDALFLPFADATAGTLTYAAGRYINIELDGKGDYVLDFNRAYNPFCAYGDPERYSCPRTPAANRLPVAIEAGERGFRHDPGDAQTANG